MIIEQGKETDFALTGRCIIQVILIRDILSPCLASQITDKIIVKISSFD